MTNGILNVIRNNPDKPRKLLQHDNNERLTAEVVDNQFHCIFSDKGGKKHRSEEATAFNFSHYLEDVEQGLGLVQTSIFTCTEPNVSIKYM